MRRFVTTSGKGYCQSRRVRSPAIGSSRWRACAAFASSRAQELGFSLKEIKDLLALRLDPDSTAAEVKKRAEQKIADIEEKIQTLRAMKKALVRLTATCCGEGSVSECPILENLDSEKEMFQ